MQTHFTMNIDGLWHRLPLYNTAYYRAEAAKLDQMVRQDRLAKERRCRAALPPARAKAKLKKSKMMKRGCAVVNWS